MITGKTYTGKFEGAWWLQGQQGNTIHGALEIKADGEMYFQTMHQFDKSNPLFGVKEYKELQGLVKSEADNHDYHVLLFDLVQVHKITAKLSRTRFFVHKALIGTSNSPISLKHCGLIVSSDRFSRWVKGTGIIIKEMKKQKDSNPIITYKQPEPINVFLGNYLTGYINFRCNHRFGPHRTIKIVERPFFNLDLPKPENLDGIIGVLTGIERFLMVLWEQYHVFSDIDVRNENKDNFRFIGSRYVQNANENFKFNFFDFQKNADSYYNTWRRVYEAFNLAIRTFFFAYADFKVDIHSRFLNYVFALEQLHRKGFRASEPLSKKDKRMYDMAMKIEQGDLKSWLESVLNKERDIRLTTRLKELCEFAELNENGQISKSELTRIKNMRHYLVHLDEEHKKTAFSAREVYEINQKLEGLFFAVLKKNMVEEKPWPAFS